MPAPGARHVLRTHLQVLALRYRWVAVLFLLLLAVPTAAIVRDILSSGDALSYHPEQHLLFGVIGALLAIGVWWGEDRFGRAFMWTTPVDRTRHALLRIAAGWLWLMAAIALVMVLLLILTLISGGSPLAVETLYRMPTHGSIDPASLQTVQHTPSPALWLVPFTAATGTYLIISALVLGLRYPLRWLAGFAVTVLILMIVSDVLQLETLFARIPVAVALGRYGLDTLLTARTEVLRVGTRLMTGETLIMWRDVPDIAEWAIATLLWLTAGAMAVAAAAYRHREKRRN